MNINKLMKQAKKMQNQMMKQQEELEAAQRVIEHVPFVRVAQAERVRTQEYCHRHAAGPVQRERVHRVEYAVFDRVEQLEVADDVFCAEWQIRQASRQRINSYISV